MNISVNFVLDHDLFFFPSYIARDKQDKIMNLGVVARQGLLFCGSFRYEFWSSLLDDATFGMAF